MSATTLPLEVLWPLPCLFQLWWPQAFLGLWPHCSSLCLRLHIAFTISSVNPADSNSTACPGTDPSSPSPRLPGPRPPPSPARPLLWSPHQHPNRLRISPQLSSWATLLEPEEMQSLRPSNPPQGTLLSERRQSSCHGPRALQSVVRITSVLIPCCSLYSLASDLLATSMSSGDFYLRSSFSWRVCLPSLPPLCL